MLDQSQLPNTLLYLTSTCAQVWAALLIFYVLLWRDLEKSIDEKKRQIWNFVNEHTASFRKALLVSLDNAPERYKQYKLDKFTVMLSTTSWDSFERLLEKLAMSSLILQYGKEFGITNPQAFWAPLNTADTEVKILTGWADIKKPKPKVFGFRIGMALIGFNIVVLGLHSILCVCWQVTAGAVAVTAILNLGFGVLMTLAVTGAVLPVYSKSDGDGVIHIAKRSKFASE